MSFPRIQRFIRNLVPPSGLEVPPGTIKVVLYAIASRADANTLECFPSRARLAIDTGVSEATIKRALKVIEKAKLVVRWRRKRNDGTLAGWHYRLVIDGPPSGWEMADESGGENVEDIQRGVSLTPLKKSNNSLGSNTGQAAPPQGVSLHPPAGQADPTIRTSEEPSEQPNTQQASVENRVCEKSYNVASLIRARWPKEALRGSGLDDLPAKVALAAQKTGRSPEKLVPAALAYLKHIAELGRAPTWIGAWFDRGEYLPFMPKLSEQERRGADDATYESTLRCWLGGDGWPEDKLGPPPDRGGWVPIEPLKAVLRAAPDSPRLRGIDEWRMMCADYIDLRQTLDGWDYEFRRLKRDGEWKGHREDPRAPDALYPAYLYERYGIPRPCKPDLRVVA